MFGLFLKKNGDSAFKNIAFVPGTDPPVPVSINTVNKITNSEFYFSNDPSDNEDVFGIEADGFTKPFMAEAQCSPGTNTIKLAIGDTADFVFNSWILLDSFVIEDRIPGIKGDPHFITWGGEHFEYHGKCDLELLSNKNFAGGKGLDVHVRTEIVRTWSYVKAIAIRIGQDILQIQGTLQDHNILYWLNGEFKGPLSTFAGFPITHKKINRKANLFTIDLQNEKEQKITIRNYRELVRVDFVNHDADTFGGSVGILGDYDTGKKLARDGSEMPNHINDYGQEWQVRADGPKLFQEDEGPQYPDKCILPDHPHATRTKLRGKDGLKAIAKKACAGVKEADREDCMFDVIAAGDTDVVGTYAQVM